MNLPSIIRASFIALNASRFIHVLLIAIIGADACAWRRRQGFKFPYHAPKSRVKDKKGEAEKEAKRGSGRKSRKLGVGRRRQSVIGLSWQAIGIEIRH